MSTKYDVIKVRAAIIAASFPLIEERLQRNINDMEAIWMLDEAVFQLKELAKEDQGINNILEGLYEVQRVVKHLRGD